MTDGKDEDSRKYDAEWRVHGREEGVYTYICHRWRDTLSAPKSEERLEEEDDRLQGGGMRKGGTWGWEEAQLSAIEWD
jgi:hypothetical protein